MREILFRGKRKPDSEWVYGYYVQTKDFLDDRKCNLIFEVDSVDYFGSEIAGVNEIDPKTVGQFTGLTDKNGTKIFEDDILQVSYHGDEIGRVCIYFRFAMYLCDVIYGYIDFDTLGMLNANYQLEVIGNAYDNPELLGGDSE